MRARLQPCPDGRTKDDAGMTDTEYTRKLDELDRLLNDPDVPMEPTRVWALLAEIAQRDMAASRREQA